MLKWSESACQKHRKDGAQKAAGEIFLHVLAAANLQVLAIAWDIFSVKTDRGAPKILSNFYSDLKKCAHFTTQHFYYIIRAQVHKAQEHKKISVKRHASVCGSFLCSA